MRESGERKKEEEEKKRKDEGDEEEKKGVSELQPPLCLDYNLPEPFSAIQ